MISVVALDDLQIWPPGDTISVLNTATSEIGTFGGTYQAANGSNHTVSGSYRLIREN